MPEVNTLVVLDALYAAESYHFAKATTEAIEKRSKTVEPSPLLVTIRKAIAEIGVERGNYDNLPKIQSVSEYLATHVSRENE